MLNPKLKLNPKIFNEEVEQVPIRKGFGQGLLLAGEKNSQIRIIIPTIFSIASS